MLTEWDECDWADSQAELLGWFEHDDVVLALPGLFKDSVALGRMVDWFMQSYDAVCPVGKIFLGLADYESFYASEQNF